MNTRYGSEKKAVQLHKQESSVGFGSSYLVTATDPLMKLAAAQSELYLQQLDGVVSQLRADMPDSKVDRKGLAMLIAQLLQFMEDALGKEVR